MMCSLALAAIVCVLFMAPAAAGASDEREALEKPAPVYPVAALSAEIEGEVVLSIDIAANGNVTALRLVSVDKPAFGFEASAKEAVARWRYKPAAHATSDVRVVVNFRLQEPTAVDEDPSNSLSPGTATYPEAAVNAGVDGRVVLSIDIALDGIVTAARLVSEEPKGMGFGESAINGVRKWRYRSYHAPRNNIRVVVTFRLNGDARNSAPE